MAAPDFCVQRRRNVLDMYWFSFVVSVDTVVSARGMQPDYLLAGLSAPAAYNGVRSTTTNRIHGKHGGW